MVAGEIGSVWEHKIYVMGGHLNKKGNHTIHRALIFLNSTCAWRKHPIELSKTEHSVVVYCGAIYFLAGHNDVRYTNDLVHYSLKYEIVTKITVVPSRHALRKLQWCTAAKCSFLAVGMAECPFGIMTSMPLIFPETWRMIPDEDESQLVPGPALRKK